MNKTNAFILHPYLKNSKVSRKIDLFEANNLVKAINLKPIFSKFVGLEKINPKTYLNSGFLLYLKEEIKKLNADLIFLNCKLAPIQQRNIEKEVNCKVIDRTGLILEIFGARAFSNEGKLQVHLASLEYQKGRLVRSWTHLERQRGGAGFMGGPGERQIESDRRQITDQINRIKKKIKKINKTRKLQRYRRKKNNIPIITIVGYTNSGKSTLFNFLTRSNILAKDMLFASLDSTMRKLKINDKSIVLVDTVGFIKDLPTNLIAAFKSTLDEIINSDLILHVMDISNSENDNNKKDVLKVLSELGIFEKDPRIINVINKYDLVNQNNQINDILSNDTILISSVSGYGMENLRKIIYEKI